MSNVPLHIRYAKTTQQTLYIHLVSCFSFFIFKPKRFENIQFFCKQSILRYYEQSHVTSQYKRVENNLGLDKPSVLALVSG